MHYCCVVMVFFNTALWRSAFSTISLRKLVFCLSVLSLKAYQKTGTPDPGCLQLGPRDSGPGTQNVSVGPRTPKYLSVEGIPKKWDPGHGTSTGGTLGPRTRNP